MGSGIVALCFGPACGNCEHSLLVYSDVRQCRLESDEQDLLEVDAVSTSNLNYQYIVRILGTRTHTTTHLNKKYFRP